MSLAPVSAPAVEAATFGRGGAEPYARALRGDAALLYLRHSDPRQATTSGGHVFDVARWNADADESDLTLLRAVTGPLLDVGCGPGRMVRAALALDIVALGLDISPAAVELSRSLGLPVVERSVFGPVPRAGHWQTVLLIDGNIGIGGDPAALLERCAELITRDGEILVETHPEADRDVRFLARIADAEGRESAEFPWAELGREALAARAGALGLTVRQSWEIAGRSFSRLALRAADA